MWGSSDPNEAGTTWSVTKVNRALKEQDWVDALAHYNKAQECSLNQCEVTSNMLINRLDAHYWQWMQDNYTRWGCRGSNPPPTCIHTKLMVIVKQCLQFHIKCYHTQFLNKSVVITHFGPTEFCQFALFLATADLSTFARVYSTVLQTNVVGVSLFS